MTYFGYVNGTRTALARMTPHPMPVPPIYQPEVAGRAVAHVAERPRRQLFVGLPTVLTVLVLGVMALRAVH